MPRVSVIMGVYNGAEKVRVAIESILNQTYSDFELIICDDGSKDNSVDIIKEIALDDDKITLLVNHENCGLAATLNKCLEAAKGEFIARMDDDDISHIDRFEKQVNFFDANAEYAIVGTSRNFIDEQGIWGSEICSGERSKKEVLIGRSFIHPSVMIRKSALMQVGGYTVGSSTVRIEDYDLWCKLYDHGYRGYNLPEILFDYYESKDSYVKRKYRFRVVEYKLKKLWLKKFNMPISYSLYAYKPLIVGLIPDFLMMTYKKYKYSLSRLVS